MANRPANAGSTSAPEPAPSATARALAWLPYLIVLAIAVGGLYFAWRGPEDAGRGTGLVGCALLAAAVFRLVLPARYAAPLSSRGKTADVLGYAVFGAGVLVLAISLP